MFPTEQQIYHRLRWDPRFDVRRCHVVITLRPSGTQRMLFLDFDVDAIPWHRIVEFWVDDELAWSRPQRIDRLDELAARGDDEAARRPPAPRPASGLAPLVPQRFDGERWVDDTRVTDGGASLRVVVWNLLFDRHAIDGDDAPRRWRVALAELAQLDADAIALVEITAGMRTLILEQPWVRAAYATTHGPDVPIPRYGQLLLAKRGLAEAGELELTRGKTALIARVGELGVAVVHLSSNRASDAVAVRTTQLDAVLAHLHHDPRTWILAGDFNGDPEEQAPLLGGAGAIDCWVGAPRDTYDLARNPIAASVSLRGRSARYDRIHAIAAPGTSGFRTLSCALVGDGHGATPPSDHFGVVVELADGGAARDLTHAPAPSETIRGRVVSPTPPGSVSGGRRFAPPASPRTALVLMPPRAAWGPVQRVRCARDGKVARWPPHLTLVFPFVDEAWLDDAVAALAPIAARQEPFVLELDRVGPINPKTTALFPSAASARAVAGLHAAIAAPFAAILERPDFHAHLTIARGAPARGEAPALDDARLTWTVDRLAVLVQHDGVYELAREIPLGAIATPRIRTGSAGAGDAGGRRVAAAVEVGPPAVDVVERVKSTVWSSVRAVAGDEAAAAIAIEVYGSAVYAPALAGDVDLLLRTGACPAQELAQLLADAHGLALHGPPWRARGDVAGRRVDLLVLAGDEPDAARWLTGPAEAELLRDHLDLHGREAAFVAAWPHVRAFARARGLERNGLGYFGGYGWALLFAIPLCHDARVCAAPAGRALAPWLRWAGALRSGARIGFDEVRADDQDDLWLAAPTRPSRNVARFMSRGTAATLFAELRRAAHLVGAADLDDAGALALVAADLATDPPPGATLAIRGTGDAARGRYEGVARRVIGELEAAHGPLRVWGRFEDAPGGWQHRISVAGDAGAARARAVEVLADTAFTVELVQPT